MAGIAMMTHQRGEIYQSQHESEHFQPVNALCFVRDFPVFWTSKVE
jgi:hypothetical protein